MLVWAVIAAAFTVVAVLRLVARLRVRSPLTPPRGEGVLLRPVDAPTDAELANLSLRVDGLVQHVASGAEPHALNRKLGHLKRALLELRPERVLVADADVAVDRELADALLGALDHADVAWAAPRPVPFGLTRGLLVQSMHSFEVLDAMTLGAPTMCGKAFALGPRGIEALLRLPDCIGEDLELAQVPGLRIVRAGRALIPQPEGDVVARFTRWMQVLKAHRPALFPTIPLLFACTPLLLVAAPRAGLALLAVRLVAAAVLMRRPGLYVEWLGAEALLLVCWVRALLSGRRVRWRGRTLLVGAHGRLQ